MSELMDIVLQCENQLGWSGQASMNPYRARAIEVGKLRGALTRHRDVTTDDLRLAIAYCARRHEPIRSTLDLLGKVEYARELQVQKERPSDLTASVHSAVGWEQTRQDEESSRWLSRLVRAHGPARADVLSDWAAAGRGEQLIA